MLGVRSDSLLTSPVIVGRGSSLGPSRDHFWEEGRCERLVLPSRPIGRRGMRRIFVALRGDVHIMCTRKGMRRKRASSGLCRCKISRRGCVGCTSSSLMHISWCSRAQMVPIFIVLFVTFHDRADSVTRFSVSAVVSIICLPRRVIRKVARSIPG